VSVPGSACGWPLHEAVMLTMPLASSAVPACLVLGVTRSCRRWTLLPTASPCLCRAAHRQALRGQGALPAAGPPLGVHGRGRRDVLPRPAERRGRQGPARGRRLGGARRPGTPHIIHPNRLSVDMSSSRHTAVVVNDRACILRWGRRARTPKRICSALLVHCRAPLRVPRCAAALRSNARSWTLLCLTGWTSVKATAQPVVCWWRPCVAGAASPLSENGHTGDTGQVPATCFPRRRRPSSFESVPASRAGSVLARARARCATLTRRAAPGRRTVRTRSRRRWRTAMQSRA